MAFREVQTPMQFPDMEKRILDFWEKESVFEKSIQTRPENKPFTFYEGPPTANGRPGIHHVISRSIKDFVCRLQTMRGYRVGRKAGWDTHGLPVEIEVEKELGIEHKDQIEAYGVDKFNQKCRDSVFKYVQEWNELTHRIGYWVDLENPYITYANDYIETVWYLLATMWKKGYLYQGFKILPYCSRCETALSSHETSLGYKEVSDRSVTAKFELTEGENRYILAWTTTPWTLPGNVALAVGAEIDYVEIEQEPEDGKKEIYYLAESRLEMIDGEYTVLRKLKGSELEGWQYKPLFDFVNLADELHRAYYVAAADFVTTEEGTGVVHTAVMYGEDDYQLGLRLGLPARHTVDEQGHFNENVDPWQGMYVKSPEVEKEIIIYLKTHNRFYKSEKYEHSYPHCWRCDSPLLYYAKKSWYIKTTAVREKLIENNQKIKWYPREVGEGRFGQWLENNVDWAISRDRYWGTPLNVWVCQSCKKQHAIESVDMLKEMSGKTDIHDLHKPYIDEITFTCPECGGVMKRTPEVIDCWFDSGAMPFAQSHYPFAKDGRFENNFPADFIAEGVDQTRGWFYSLLAISTLITGEPSYKSCISIELILDKAGQKMSKTKGNAVNPFAILDHYGADPLRWYLYTVSPPWVPTRFDEEGVQEIQRKFFGTLTNTYGFFVLYANIDGFEYDKHDLVPVTQRAEIDRWILSRSNSLVKRVDQLLSRYDITKAAREIQTFVIDDLSNWYIRRNRRRFWKAEMNEDKRAAYQTLFEILMTQCKLIAPFAPFISEEMYQNLNSQQIDDAESVHLSYYPSPDLAEHQFIDSELEARMEAVRTVVSLSHSARNDAKIKVRQPLEKIIVIPSGESQKEAILKMASIIKEEINVRHIEFAENAKVLLTKSATPNFKKLGPIFGSHVNQAAEIIRKFTDEEISRLEAGEKIHISLDKAKHGDVSLEDIQVQHQSAPGFVAQSEGALTVGLDTNLTEDLIYEGLARELVNRIQNMRKDAGFEVTDRITVAYQTDDSLTKAIELKKTYIMDEVLASKLENVTMEETVSEIQLEIHKIRIQIQKVGQ